MAFAGINFPPGVRKWNLSSCMRKKKDKNTMQNKKWALVSSARTLFPVLLRTAGAGVQARGSPDMPRFQLTWRLGGEDMTWSVGSSPLRTHSITVKAHSDPRGEGFLLLWVSQQPRCWHSGLGHTLRWGLTRVCPTGCWTVFLVSAH